MYVWFILTVVIASFMSDNGDIDIYICIEVLDIEVVST